MKKYGRSWWKPNKNLRLSVVKEVDASIFEDKSTGIPTQIYDRFPCVNQLELEDFSSIGKGNIYVNLIYKGSIYPCDLTKKVAMRDGKTSSTVVLYFNKDLVEIFKKEFSETWAYIQKKKQEYEVEKKERAAQTGKIAKHYLEITNKNAAYIEFYKQELDNQYEIKCINDSNYLKAMQAMDNEREENDNGESKHMSRDISMYVDYSSISEIDQYMKSKGFIYVDEMLSNFYLSLKSKPFTILAGISGTGKSKLVRLFAEAIGAQFELIPVKPDWSDATDLLGYRDLNQTFHKGRFIEIINEAKDNLSQPYIICLDEMNLARVEYYFSDFLSLIESRRWQQDEIITDHFSGEDLNEFYIPENVYIVGTVNMDETTFQFSKKVLDRANAIELSKVDLTYSFEEEDKEDVQPIILHNDALKSKYLVLKECNHEKEEVGKIIDRLVVINEYLKPCGLQFAYRTRDEIVFYMLYNKELGLLNEAEAFDYQILQKVLPRINGTSPRVRRLILSLCYYCLNQEINLASESYEVEALEERVQEAVYPKSYQKLVEMLRRYDEDGFTSFWF